MRRQIIPTVLAVITTLVAGAAAQAQESRGSRFSYAPNYWKAEEPRVPRAMQPAAHAVRAGAVPSQSMLGLDPHMLAPTPAAAPQVAARPAMTQVTPNVFVPRTQPSFKSDFGKPVSTQPMQIAQLPQPAAAPIAAPAQAKPAQAAPVAKVARHSGGRRRPVSTAVSGQLRRPSNSVGQMAAPATYGNNVGYVPGGSVHSSSGGAGSGTVTGRIVRGK